MEWSNAEAKDTNPFFWRLTYRI